MIFIMIVYGVAAYIFSYGYDRNIGSYYELSNQASTATLKVQYLQTFRDKLAQNDLLSGQAVLIFPTPQTSVDEQTKILDSLIDRLNKTAGMNESSFEYQQALYQITRNEFCEGIGCENVQLFKDLYTIKNGIIYNSLIMGIAYLILFLALVFGAAWMDSEGM